MSSKTPILTDAAPKPLPGIYSQAIVAGGFVFVSGAVPMDAVTMKLIDGDIQAHTVSNIVFCHGKILNSCSINVSKI